MNPPTQRLRLQIGRDAKVTALYNDAHVALMEKGKAEVTRVSYLRWFDGAWHADLSPVAAGVVLGPYRLRSDALEAEVRYLDSLLFG